MNKGLFSSKTGEWETPHRLFNELDKEFGFTLDVCATKKNTKCARYFDKKTDGLSQLWTGTCWMNPPYGRVIGKWVKKAYLSSLMDEATVVCLLPARTDTAWFHDYILGKGTVEFLRGRLCFSRSKGNAPFPSMIIVYDPTVRTE